MKGPIGSAYPLIEAFLILPLIKKALSAFFINALIKVDHFPDVIDCLSL